MWKVVLFVCLVLGSALGQTLVFNTTWEPLCINGCDFSDPLIWVPPVAPNVSSIVTLNFTSGNSAAYLFVNSTTTVGMLIMAQANLVVLAGTFVPVQIDTDAISNITVVANASITLSTVIGLLSANLTLRDAATASAGIQSFSNLHVLDTAQVQAQQCQFTGFVEVSAQANLNCSQVYLSTAQPVNIGRRLDTPVLYVYNANTLQNGLNAGIVRIASNVTLNVMASFSGQVNMSTEGAALNLISIAAPTFNSLASPNNSQIFGSKGIVTLVNTFNVQFQGNGIDGNQTNPAWNGTLVLLGNSSITATSPFQISNVLVTQDPINSEVPAISGAVVITQILLVVNSSVAVSNIWAASVAVQNGALALSTGNLTVTSFSADALSNVSVSGSSVLFASNFTANGSLWISNNAGIVATNATAPFATNGQLSLTDNAFVNWWGACKFTGSLSTAATSALNCVNANFSLTTATIAGPLSITFLYVNNTLSLPNGIANNYTYVYTNGNLTVSSVLSTQLYVATNASVYVNSVPAVAFEPFNLNNPAIDGQGTLTLYNSVANITSTTKSPVFPGTLYLSGNTSLLATNFATGNLYTTAIVNATNTVVLQGNGFEVKGTAKVAAQTVAFGSGITVSGSSVIFEGPFWILQNSTLRTTGSFLLTGNLENNGTLDSKSGSLTIVGNYTSNQNSTVSAELSDNDKPAIHTNGSMFIAGNLIYSLGKQLKSQQFLVASAQVGTITGSFYGSAEPSSDSDVKQTMAITYNPTAVYVKYNLSIHDLPFWIWIIVSVGGAVLIGVVVLVIVMRRRRRAGYNPVYA